MIIRSILKEFKSDVTTYLYLIVILYLQLVLSMNLSSYGTTFVDLKYTLNSSIDKISLVILFQSIGFLIGCCFGFIYKFINRQLTISILTLVFSILVVLIPYCVEIWQLYVCSFITGLGYGVYFNSNNVWLLELFGDRAGPILQLSGFVYGVGTILGPLLYQSFVTGESHIENVDQFSALNIDSSDEYIFVLEDNNTVNMNLNSTYLTLNSNNSSVFDNITRRDKLKVPFLICGIIVIIGSVLLLILFFFKKYKINIIEIEKGDSSDKKITGDTWFGKFVIILCMLLFSFHCASDDSYVQFTATYLQYIPLGLSASKSAEIVSYMGLVFTISQGLSIFIAIKLRPQYMLAYHFSILLIGILIMYFGKNSLTLIWIGILLMSFGIGAIFPLIFSFMSQQIEVTDRIGTVLNFASKIPGLFLPSIIGGLIEKHPDILLYVMLFDLIVCTIIIISILISVQKFKKLV